MEEEVPRPRWSVEEELGKEALRKGAIGAVRMRGEKADSLCVCQHLHHHRPSNTDFGADFITAGSTGARAACHRESESAKPFHEKQSERAIASCRRYLFTVCSRFAQNVET